MSNKSGTSSQIISLPNGGGALHGVGEKFSPDLHTGTGNFTIPLTLPPGRNGFQPQLSLGYSTGSGNGPFGLGWNLSVPGVMRKTSKGIPRYDDGNDTFILSGAEDLVPVTVDPPQPGVTRYHPRTEGLFARISHCHDAINDYWEVRSKDGLVSFYGTPRPDDAGKDWQDPAVIADPAYPTHIFAWKLTQTRDPFGNRIVYSYDRDSSPNALRQWDQLYLREIQYVDYVPPTGEERFLVTVKFEYEVLPERYPDDVPLSDKKRMYPFSDYRAGFEIRTRKRCTRIKVRTRAEQERVVRDYNFVYLDQRPEKKDSLPLNGVSLLSQFEVVGYDDAGVQTQELPPLEFGYTQFEPKGRKFFPITGPDMPPASLAHPEYEVADLLGNGLPDVLEMNGMVRYWRNQGEGRLDRPREMRDAPAGVQLADSGVQLIDADGDGRIDLLVTMGAMTGYFPSSFGGYWDRRSFQRYQFAPSFNLEDPEVKLVDLTGDGVTDAVRSGSRLECFFNDPKRGWKEMRWVERQEALEKFPSINFSDPRVKWGDMTGDGMQDIVLVYDGSVEYWPNLGYGKWSRAVSMQNSPRFRYGYDPRRILVGDVDGDGLADMVYVDDTKVTLWINQSGNGWSDPIEITGTPPVSDKDAVRLIDMLGSGISGVLWSTDAGALSCQNMFFLDFTGGIKPYLLHEMDNHIGSLTRVEYAPSTRFYLEEEQRPETRWKTPLPFPVQVVAKVEVIDQISNGKLTTEYSYHHGYWDGAEREFRGFGRVDQRDTEVFETFNDGGLHADRPFEHVAEKAFSPPLETRTWFHQGPVGDEFGDWEELDLSSEYWGNDPQVISRPSSMMDFLQALPRRVKRDALRVLRGHILRTELYALDRTEREKRPYTVTESLPAICGVVDEGNAARLVCDMDALPPAWKTDATAQRIFFPHALAQRTTQWERGDEPMTQFSFTEDYDAFGQPQRQTTIACPRGWRSLSDTPVSDTASGPYLATRSRTVYAEPLNREVYIHDRVARITSYEMKNKSGKKVQEIANLPDTSPDLEVIGQTLHFYDGLAFQGLLFGQLGDRGALTRTENLVLTQDILHDAYRSGNVVLASPEEPPYLVPGVPAAWNADYPEEFRGLLPALAGYIYQPGGAGSDHATGYFTTTERRRYDFHDLGDKGRGLLQTVRDPFGRDTEIVYDNPYQLLPVTVTDPVGLQTQARYNYRVLQPAEVTEPNDNKTVFTFSPLGLLKTVAVQGQANEGDQHRPSVQIAYDFLAFTSKGQPISVRTLRQLHHDTETDVPLPKRDETITIMEYSDGFGRLLQTRTQAEDITFGDTIFGDAGLLIDQSVPNQSAIGHAPCTGGEDDVVVSGWQTYDNKGRVIEKYESFFSCGWQYVKPTPAQLGQKITMYYDPRGQVIRTVNPDGSEQWVLYGVPADLTKPQQFTATPWEAYTYDANDLAPLSHHPTELLPDGSPKPLTDRAPVHHHFTPTNIIIDALGRTVETIVRNRTKPDNPGDPLPPMDEYHTRSRYDIRGNLLTVTDALGRLAFQHVYDLANQQLRIDSIDAGIRRVILDATGNVVEQRDSKGALTLHGYDVLSRPTHLWARDGAGQDMTVRERLLYGDGSDKNQPPSERDANRTANRLGKLYHHYDEAGLLTIGVYDFKGNVLEKVRQVIQDSQILTVFDTAAAHNWQVQPYRVNWQPPDGTSLKDHASNLLDTPGYRTTVLYDALNRVKLLRYPEDVDGARKELHPEYNRAGALEKVVLENTSYVNHIAYNAKGQRVLIAYGNGVMTRHTYDPRTFRLVRMRTERYSKLPGTSTYQPTGIALQDFAYEYDLVGNIKSIQNRTPESGVLNNPEAIHITDPQLAQLLVTGDALLRHFEYDALYWLRSATGRECDTPPPPPPWLDEPRCTDLTKTRSYAEHYVYDKVGNIQQLKHLSNGSGFTRDFSLVPGNNRLHIMTMGLMTFAYEYDANGNMSSETTSRHFEWDYADRMRAFRTQTDNVEPTTHAHYLYDAGGQRVKKLVRKQGQVEVTVYIDGIFEYQRIVKAGSVEENNTLHVMDNQNRIALVRVGSPFTKDTTPAVKFQLGDHLGSCNLVIDDTANWINREEYTPYGETSFGSFARKQYRFTGKERDEESGLNYHGARYYASCSMKWISCDPAGKVDGPNLYTYVANNPIRLRDPSGMQSVNDTSGGPALSPQPPEITNTPSQPSTNDSLSQPDDAIKIQPFTRPSASNIDSSGSGVITIKEITLYGQIPKSPELIPTPQAENELVGQNASSAGGMPTNPITTIRDTKADLLAQQNPALAPMIGGAERQDIFINEIAPLLMIPLTSRSLVLGAAEGVAEAGGLIETLPGSGPAPGVLEVSSLRPSVGTIRRYTPRRKGIEFVFDPVAQRFAVGKAKQGLPPSTSPHQHLAELIDADPRTVVGGIFRRGANGEILLDEASGHYGMNWTPQVRQQAIDFLQERTGQPVNQTPWSD